MRCFATRDQKRPYVSTMTHHYHTTLWLITRDVIEVKMNTPSGFVRVRVRVRVTCPMRARDTVTPGPNFGLWRNPNVAPSSIAIRMSVRTSTAYFTHC